MITAIRTNNFKKLENFSASFADGTNLVFGENGQGKSTCFDAIRFALFGSKGVSGTVDSLTTWDKDKMWVELDINGFTIRRTTSNCKITNADGEVVASGNAPSIKFVEDMLACSVKDFDLLYMSKQNETAGLITFGATELNRKVEEYAGVATIDKIIKALGSEINGCQIALQSFEFIGVDELEGKIATLNGEVESLRVEHKVVKDKEELLRQELAKIGDEMRSVRDFNSEQDRIAQEQEQHTRRIERLSASVDACKVALDRASNELLETNQVDEEEIERLQEELDKVESLNAKLAKVPNVADLTVELESAQHKLDAYSAYAAALPELEKAKDSCQAEYERLKEKNAEALREYKKACSEAEDGICSGCKRPLEGHDPETAEKHKAEKGKAVANSKTLMDAAKANLDSASANLSAHHKTNPGTGWEDEVSKLQERIEKANTDRTHLDQQLSKLGLAEQLRGQILSMNSDLRAHRTARRSEQSAQTDYDEAVESLEQAKSAQTEAPQPKKPVDDLEAKFTELNEKGVRLANEKSTIASDGRVKAERVKGLENQLESAKANNKKMSELEKQMDTSKQLRKYLNEERVKFMEGVWRTILGTASHFINKSTGGWITAVGRNDKGDFTFTENGYEAVAKESASGAQKAFIGTAIKVGLAQAKMGSSAMILLDEPTADMRDDRASQLAAGLMMLPGQKVMITHRDSERMIAQNIIHVGE